jgi:hypothetical protein
MQSRSQLRRTALITPASRGLLQRKGACGGTPGPTGECEACREKQLRGKAARSVELTEVPRIVHEVLRSHGQPLDAGSLAFMEPRFGHDFSKVRVHTDGRAPESAKSVNALAYTVGSHVVFAAGQYQPATAPGQRLLSN